MSYLIYIGDPSVQTAVALEEMCRDAGYYTRVFHGLGELLERSAKTLPDIQVLHPALLLEGRLPRKIFYRVPTLIYGDTFSPDQIETLYRFGVKRVIWGSNDEEILLRILAAVKMMLYRQNELRRVQREYLTHGSIETFSLAEVLQNALLEKKNLKVKVKSVNDDAKLRTFQGHLVSAYAGTLTNEDAVLKTLQMPRGSFVIRAYRKTEEYAPIAASTLALLAESHFQARLITRFCERVGSENPEIRLVASKNGLKVSRPEARLLQSVRTHKTLRDVLSHSPMSIRKSLQTLERFQLSGILNFSGENKQIAEAPRVFRKKEVDFIRKNLMPNGGRQGTLVVLGLPGSGRSDMIRTMAGNHHSQIQTLQSIDFTRISLGTSLTMAVVGSSIEESFLTVLDRLSQSMIGCVLLLDNREPDKFEFINYLFSRLVQIYPVPYVIGLTNTSEPEEDARTFGQRFKVPAGVAVQAVEPDSFDSVIELIFKLQPAEIVEERDV